MKTFFNTTFLLFGFVITSLSQNRLTYTITNVEQTGELIIITYQHNPVGDEADAEYDVSVRLTRETDKQFSVDITNARGDIGDGKFVGNNCRILWAYKKQLPKGLPFDDIEFELTITKNKGIPSWVWYTGGAAVIGAGTFLYLSNKKEEETGSVELPGPPNGRPY
jgi:hypothetical protein